MYDPYITAVNAERASLAWYENLTLNASNLYTPGFRERRMFFSDFIQGADSVEHSYKAEQGKALPGRAPSNLFIEGKGYFVVRTPEGKTLYTRVGDFKFDSKGTLTNELGHKIQGYITDDKGNVLPTGTTQYNANGSPNNPAQTQGGTGALATTDITMWLDPANGKFFGKFDEYKVKADGTVIGSADNGKKIVPLYKLAIVNFVAPENLTEVTDNYFVPSARSGQPVEGTGEIRQGLIEASNSGLREIVSHLQQAKLQLDMTNKLITTNKQLLNESLQLLRS
jgi:flagellar hook protein FlgE